MTTCLYNIWIWIIAIYVMECKMMCFKVFTHKKIVASSFKKKENMDIYVFKNNIVAKLIQDNSQK